MTNLFKKENYGEIVENEICADIVAKFDAFRSELPSTAEMLIVPQRWEANGDRMFSEESVNFIKFCKQNGTNFPTSQREQDSLLTLHSCDIWLPIVYIANAVIMPTVIGLFVNFISAKIGKKKKEKHDVHFEAIVKDGDKVKSIKFDGDAKTFEKKFTNIDYTKWSKK